MELLHPSFTSPSCSWSITGGRACIGEIRAGVKKEEKTDERQKEEFIFHLGMPPDTSINESVANNNIDYNSTN